jgi:hypothetical protein
MAFSCHTLQSGCNSSHFLGRDAEAQRNYLVRVGQDYPEAGPRKWQFCDLHSQHMELFSAEETLQSHFTSEAEQGPSSLPFFSRVEFELAWRKCRVRGKTQGKTSSGK